MADTGSQTDNQSAIMSLLDKRMREAEQQILNSMTTIKALGEFRITPAKDGLSLICFGPKDFHEAKTIGVPNVAFALWTSDKMVRDDTKLAAFLNAALLASQGNFEPLKALFPPQAA